MFQVEMSNIIELLPKNRKKTIGQVKTHYYDIQTFLLVFKQKNLLRVTIHTNGTYVYKDIAITIKNMCHT